jgi:broad specificity phosphatase PhoE
MRTVYLIRHGLPDIPDGRCMCLGSTDLPLGIVGRLQAALAGAALSSAGLSAVYCSRLSRSRQTAEAIGSPIALPGLEEMDAGAWDGLFFEEIRARWPELYELRGRDFSVSPPGAERREDGLARFSAALNTALAGSEGDIAVVAHASVMQTMLCAVQGLPLEAARGIALPYGSITRLAYENGGFSVVEIGVSPHPKLNKALCESLLSAAGTPEAVSAHCAAVAETALGLARALSAAGVALDEPRIYAAAMLHDIARTAEHHAETGAGWLAAIGYPAVADIIRQHHDPDDPARTDEAAVVFVADKLVLGTARVGLCERFEASRKKCLSAEAVDAYNRRYRAVMTAAENINSTCRKDVVK